MIECNPRGICSRSYYLSGDGHQAVVEFNWIGSSGGLQIDGRYYEVKKCGIFRSQWFLQQGDRVFCSVRYPSMFSSNMEITTPGGSLTLMRHSMFSSEMGLIGQGYHLSIKKVHIFTRRARMTGSYSDFTVAAFAFWLIAQQWEYRRQKGSATHSGAGT